jgi:hypothetical protein
VVAIEHAIRLVRTQTREDAINGRSHRNGQSINSCIERREGLLVGYPQSQRCCASTQPGIARERDDFATTRQKAVVIEHLRVIEIESAGERSRVVIPLVVPAAFGKPPFAVRDLGI